MILTREITIKISESNYSYYEEFGYETSIGEDLVVPIELLSNGSHQKISCKCDGCGIIKDVMFKNYIKYGNTWGDYFCRKCSEVKRKKTLSTNHGVDYPIQNENIKSKFKKTMIERFGVDNPTKSKQIIDKRKKPQ